MACSDAALVLTDPYDAHLHLRDGQMLELVAPLSSESFSGAVIMPNLVPPVDSLQRLLDYKKRIEAAVPQDHRFAPSMTLFMRAYTAKELEAAKEHILGIKLYPAGATTNSEAGVKAISAMEPTLKAMEELEIPLLVHGESAGFVMDREREFASTYRMLAEKFPRLSITMEHITTQESAALLSEYENLRATITLQHLLADMDALAGGMLQPHWFCKPILKRPEDLAALRELVFSGHERVMFGSDSAPHPRKAKESCGCAAGCFTAPFALQALAELFEEHGALERLQGFVSDHAKANYGLQLPQKQVLLKKEPFTVPERYTLAESDFDEPQFTEPVGAEKRGSRTEVSANLAQQPLPEVVGLLAGKCLSYSIAS